MRLFLLLSFVFFLFGCGKKVTRHDAETNPQPLVSAKAGIELWAEKCQGGVSKKDCGDGDSTLWNGLLCAAGESFACDAVRNSQDDVGRVWRSPRLRSTDPKNTFSRDMGLGTLAFLARTKDVAFGDKWSAYINEQKGLCEKENGSCTVSPTFFWVYNSVASKVGFAKLSTAVLYESQELAGVDDASLVLEANTTPSGYQTHLVGIKLYIKILLDQWNGTLQIAADKIHAREPNNLFFEFLAKGKSQNLVDKLVSRMPLGPNDERDQWCWERTDSENACQESMGWDFIFMIDLLSK